MEKRYLIFVNSLFFVLGFSIIFSLVGVLLQTVLSNVAYTAQIWLGRIGGVVIIFFGLFMAGLFQPKFLLKEKKFTVRKNIPNYLHSFLFGAAFAVGWTPCVSAALGAILALATIYPSSAFILLVAYSLGIGLPFIIAGLFLDKVTPILNRWSRFAYTLRYFFATLIIVLGVLIFTQRLSEIANFPFIVNSLVSLGLGTSAGASINTLTLINVGISFTAGLFSFISPCVLPLVPAYLSYLASITVKNEK